MDKDKINTPLLRYLKKELNNPNIFYKTPPKRLTGGYETQIFSFQLEGVSDGMSKPLVVRIFSGPRGHRKRREGTVMKYLAKIGYPTPFVYFDCFDPSILGANFIVMDFVPGITLFEYNKDVPKILADTHIHLHRIDSGPLRKHLISAGWEESTHSGLTWRETYIYDNNLNWLKPALKWIKDNKPKSTPVICHGDFHSLNILIDEGKVSGVLDWSLNRIEDPCFDIATTIMDMSVMGPIVLPQYGESFNKKVTDEYLEYYREKSPVDIVKLDYFKAFKCLMMMVEFETGSNVWHTPGILEAITELFGNITGIRLRRN